MAIAPGGETGRTLIFDGLAQNDINMAHHKLIDLDTSNLPPIGIPGSIHPPANEWLHDWDAGFQTWATSRPQFIDIGPDNGTLTPDQQSRISQVGLIRFGQWQGSPLNPDRVPTLDAIRTPIANVSLAGKRLTLVANPVDPGDAVNKGFMDFLLQGLQPKQAVRLATTHAVLFTESAIDGKDLVFGDRILVKDQSSLNVHLNGIWTFGTGTAGHWERADDADSTPELLRAYCTVLEGDVNGGTSWVEVSPIAHDPPTTGDDVHFVQFSSGSGGGSGSVIAGAGMVADGNTLNVVGTPSRIVVNADDIDIDSGYPGQTSINTVGNITDGTWSGDIISGAFGGTGTNNAGRTIGLCGNLSTVIPIEYPDVGGGRNLAFKLKDHTSIFLPVTGEVATTSGIETFKNKNIVKRTVKIASAMKPAINVNVTDVFHITGLMDNITSMTDQLSGTPDNGQELFIWIRSGSGGGPPLVTINWGAAWTASPDLPLPVSLAPLERIFCHFVYNDDTSLWVLTQKVEHLA